MKPQLTYEQHLRALTDALFEAVPTLTAHQFCEDAGLGKSWLSDFRKHGRASLRSAEKAVGAVSELCPMGERGDEVRRLLSMFVDSESRAA